jgi:RNA polymerase sigma-70 factor (ECF subfamily)
VSAFDLTQDFVTDRMDDGVIRRAQSGDRAAIGELYTIHRRGIYRYLYYQVGDIHAAEDLTAEVFIQMIRALPGYQARGVPFQAWLYRIARNASIDYFRKMSKRQYMPLDEEMEAGEDSPETFAARSLTSDRLREALARLNKAQRDVIILRFIVEMPIAEVARVLGKREDAIKGLQRRGLLALRSILSDFNWAVDHDGLG